MQRKALKQFSKHILVLLIVFLILLLTSCASKNEIVTKSVNVYPPQAYIVPCVSTKFTGETFGEAVEHLILVTAERDICANQIENIRKWVNERKKLDNK
ncbi:Rz1-like lysis system protein LysC [Pasteurella bettyae]|uniref:Rz1-like lysis system protein LysC n=1 Tax=Pasteurella bettyae TaxID=752 RepID=UPI003D27B785